MDQLKNMKQSLVSCVQAQLSNIASADYHELGAAVDMIKDISEAIYYCSIAEAMEEKEEQMEKGQEKYYTVPMPMYYPHMPMDYNYNYREVDRQDGRMYYNGGGSSSRSGGSSDGRGGSRGYDEGNRGNDARGGGTRGYTEREYPQMRLDMRDPREGRSPMSRRSYMESKEMHHDKAVKMKELESYIQELGKDITEMIHDASPEEKQLLQKKLSALATKLDV